ncbi:MAG: hypothetical protein H6724_03420 [Sandaracinus sp.]|nr:hypothetical protein [Sandaracinus sp.]MCB9623675.1 hypothetical protein [Sandaracinus sp.]
MPDRWIAEVEKWQRLYFGAVLIAIVLLVVQVATEWAWLDWPRALAWFGAAYASYREGRARRRLDEDGSWALLRALACVAFGFLALL